MLLKLIFSLIIMVSCAQADPMRNILHFQPEQSEVLYGEVSAQLDSMVSFERIPAYDINGVECGIIIFMFEKPLYHLNVDRKDKICDMSDLVMLVDFVFGDIE